MEQIVNTAKYIGIIIAEVFLTFYFCRQYIKKMMNHIDIGKGVKSQNEIDLDIIQKMDYFKELLKADRILLFEFHNGQHYSNYRSALKMSPSYEVFRASLDSVREKCSNLPIAIMPKFISCITNKGVASCTDIEKIKNDMGNSYEFKKALGIKSFYDLAIKDKDNNIIGFVAIQWNDTMPDDFNKNDAEKLAWYLEESIKKLMERDRKIKKSFFRKK